MSGDSWIKPRSTYEEAAAEKVSSAKASAESFYLELKQREASFAEHGFEIYKKDNLVAVKIGHIDIMRVVFGYGGEDMHRVTDGVREACRETLAWDCQTSQEAKTRFKNQLSSAVDHFYKKQDTFRALGIV